MAKLEHLKPSFSELAADEKQQLLMAIRANRRIAKTNPRTAKNGAKAPKDPSTKKGAKKLLDALTPEMAAELLASWDRLVEQSGTKTNKEGDE